jgi:hypothetical protein
MMKMLLAEAPAGRPRAPTGVAKLSRVTAFCHQVATSLSEESRLFDQFS